MVLQLLFMESFPYSSFVNWNIFSLYLHIFWLRMVFFMKCTWPANRSRREMEGKVGVMEWNKEKVTLCYILEKNILIASSVVTLPKFHVRKCLPQVFHALRHAKSSPGSRMWPRITIWLLVSLCSRERHPMPFLHLTQHTYTSVPAQLLYSECCGDRVKALPNPQSTSQEHLTVRDEHGDGPPTEN